MRTLLLPSFLLISVVLHAQDKDSISIKQSLDVQTACWNRGDLECFMETYWKNDSLMFVGKSGITYGWQNTLDNYRKGYPDTTAMGKLHFTIIKMKRLSPEYYFVTGKWQLQRSIGNLSGHFTLLFRKTGRGWLIIADHSS